MSGFFLEERDENFGDYWHDKKDHGFNTWWECVENQCKHNEQPNFQVPISSDIIVLTLEKKIEIPLSIFRLGINTEDNYD